MAIEEGCGSAARSRSSKIPTVRQRPPVIEFAHRTCCMMVSGNLNSRVEALMDGRNLKPTTRRPMPGGGATRLAGALPAFGIIAAVLGVVNTMQARWGNALGAGRA